MLCNTKNLRVWQASLFLFGCLVFFISSISAVPEGASCGYKPDSSPFCDNGLSCDFFQCVSTSDPTCAEAGGYVCDFNSYCDSSYLSNTIENWCCSQPCVFDGALGSIGEWCALDSDCEDGLECIYFKCNDPYDFQCGDFSSFCSSDSDCCTDLICDVGRCTYEVLTWSSLPSECIYPNYIACNSGSCEISEANCYGGVVGKDCTWDGYMINSLGQKVPCEDAECSFLDVDCYADKVTSSISNFIKEIKFYLYGLIILIILIILWPYVKLLGRLF